MVMNMIILYFIKYKMYLVGLFVIRNHLYYWH